MGNSTRDSPAVKPCRVRRQVFHLLKSRCFFAIGHYYDSKPLQLSRPWGRCSELFKIDSNQVKSRVTGGRIKEVQIATEHRDEGNHVDL